MTTPIISRRAIIREMDADELVDTYERLYWSFDDDADEEMQLIASQYEQLTGKTIQ